MLFIFLSLLLAVFGLVLVLLASFMMFDRFLTFVRNDNQNVISKKLSDWEICKM